jgi:hypothetical protein
VKSCLGWQYTDQRYPSFQLGFPPMSSHALVGNIYWPTMSLVFPDWVFHQWHKVFNLLWPSRLAVLFSTIVHRIGWPSTGQLTTG